MQPGQIVGGLHDVWQFRVLRAASSDANASPVIYSIRHSAILAGSGYSAERKGRGYERQPKGVSLKAEQGSTYPKGLALFASPRPNA